MKHKLVIIYHPIEEKKFCTKDIGDEYKVVDTINCEPTRVDVVYMEDGIVKGESYVMMPYYMELF